MAYLTKIIVSILTPIFGSVVYCRKFVDCHFFPPKLTQLIYNQNLFITTILNRIAWYQVQYVTFIVLKYVYLDPSVSKFNKSQKVISIRITYLYN